ncbi:MAG: 50S ribosomal protein L2 [Nanoarchaeota archaeon]|nr:50S ribosomal protein L2 [Nanoarchaeota archaeon]
MGKNLIQQRRGRGSSTFRAPSFRYPGKAEHPKIDKNAVGKIEDILHSQGHTAPLIVVNYPEGYNLAIAPEGKKVGDEVSYGKNSEIRPGNTLPLAEIPEGTPIFNIESKPGDGGKFVRSSGAAARITTKSIGKVIVKLPSKKQKEFSSKCLATIGTVAGSGRTEKPFMKAGKKYFSMKAKNKFWPSVSGTSMNAVAHPFGSKSSHTKGRPTQSSRNSPPGRKVGKIAPRRTGRKK